MTDDKCISVIVPIYNIEEYIDKCINSIINQSYRNLEIILVDDGSVDDSGNICDKYASQDERISVIHKANGGLSDARNSGLDAAKGDVISFIDGDDQIHPQMYEILMHIMEESDADIVSCRFSYNEKDLEESYDISDIYISEMSGTEAFLNPEKILQSSCVKIYKQSIYDNIRYPMGKLHEDEYVLHEVLYKADKVAFVDAPLYYYTIRPGSIMQEMTYKRYEDALGAFENRILYIKQVGWDEVINAAIKQYCDYCIKIYEGIKTGACDKLDKSILNILKRNVRDMISDNRDILIGKRYRLFSISPGLYFLLVRR